MTTITGRYTLAVLEELPTLCVGQAEDLKIQTESERVWLCRCGIADGLPYDNTCTIERLVDGRWVTVAEYPAV